MRKLKNDVLMVVGTLIITFFAGVAASAEEEKEGTYSSGFNLREGVTEISGQVYDLHMLMFSICVGIAVLVFGAMFISIYLHRKSRGASPAHFHENVKVEVAWTIVPFIILVLMAIPAARTLIAMEDTSEPDMTVLVTGSQWKWHYKYMDSDVAYYSLLATQREQISNRYAKGENYLLEVDRPLVVPTGQKIRFLITSDDVIHSWWVPDFAVKKDANPGFINEAWTNINEPGIYRGQCAELCGKEHAFMPIVVIAKTPAEFESWMREQEERQRQAKEEEQRLLAMSMSMEELMSVGEKIYNSTCAACHMPTGEGLPGVFPALKGNPITLEDMEGHINVVYNGRAGTAMQAFGKMLSLKEIAAVVTYERNAWGNATGDVVQPKDVNAIVKGQ